MEKRRKTRIADQEARERWDAIRATVFARDKGRCRVCGVDVKNVSLNPKTRAHTHHIVYRSAGGSDLTNNLILACASCHCDEHEHRIRIWGDGNATISVDVFNLETGKVERHLEREVPA